MASENDRNKTGSGERRARTCLDRLRACQSNSESSETVGALPGAPLTSVMSFSCNSRVSETQRGSFLSRDIPCS